MTKQYSNCFNWEMKEVCENTEDRKTSKDDRAKEGFAKGVLGFSNQVLHSFLFSWFELFYHAFHIHPYVWVGEKGVLLKNLANQSVIPAPFPALKY